MPITPNNTTFTVTASSQKILSGNSARNVLTIVNQGSNDVYISKGVAAVVGQGIYLVPGGGSLSFSTNKDGVIFKGDIFAITGTSTSVVTICEEYNQP
jgi:hypothetical protein